MEPAFHLKFERWVCAIGGLPLIRAQLSGPTRGGCRIPLLDDEDLFQDTVERTGNLDASFVALGFAENVKCSNRPLRLDAPTTRNEPG